MPRLAGVPLIGLIILKDQLISKKAKMFPFTWYKEFELIDQNNLPSNCQYLKREALNALDF